MYLMDNNGFLMVQICQINKRPINSLHDYDLYFLIVFFHDFYFHFYCVGNGSWGWWCTIMKRWIVNLSICNEVAQQYLQQDMIYWIYEIYYFISNCTTSLTIKRMKTDNKPEYFHILVGIFVSECVNPVSQLCTSPWENKLGTQTICVHVLSVI